MGLIDDILKKYTKDVKVVLKNFPLSFHKQAMKAARYVMAADRQGRDKYLALHHKVMDNYRGLKQNEDLPLEYAKELGIDVEKLKADMNDPAIQAQIDLEIKQMRTSGIPRLSVPKFLINGREPQGRSLEVFTAMIEEELKKKK